MKTEIARGWGLRVGGSEVEKPYLAGTFEWVKNQVCCSEIYHRPVRVVLIPLAEYRRLKRIEKENAK